MNGKALRTVVCSVLFAASGSVAGNWKPQEHADPPQFDARRLKTGTFVYRDLEGSQVVGRSEITIGEIQGSGNYRFSAVVTGKITQSWEVVSTRAFDPISASLRRAGTPAFDIRYSSGRVTGYMLERHVPAPRKRQPVNDAVPSGTVDQRIDWAAVSAADLEHDRAFGFSVYDPVGMSQVLVKVGAVESVVVLAGRFEAYRIQYEIRKRSGAETYEVWVSRDQPHIMVREKFPDGFLSNLAQIH